MTKLFEIDVIKEDGVVELQANDGSNKRYGICYMGSKNSIARQLVECLPKRKVLYDVFCGGGAVVHAALESGKFAEIHANDKCDIVDLLQGAFEGKYRDEQRFIDRETFYELKDSDPYVKYCWSFGAKGDMYIHGKDKEEFKKMQYMCVLAETVHERRLYMREVMRRIYKMVRDALISGAKKSRSGVDYKDVERYADILYFLEIEGRVGLDAIMKLERIQQLQSYYQLQGLERLERLERLQGQAANKVIFSKGDYRDLQIPDGDDIVIYCDPPYKGTGKYNKEGFDHHSFYEWAKSRSYEHGNLVFISEYAMPENDFRKVIAFSKLVKMQSQGKPARKEDCVFVPINQKLDI